MSELEASPMNEDDEKICRYCLEDESEGELISPCACAGGQKYVHLSCLRRWQRMVLVSQPTHPAFYRDDVRHHKCNVCTSDFSCEPPTRHELMASFTGPELAALIYEACIIGSNEVFDQELENQLGSLPRQGVGQGALRAATSYDHWIRGCYLITQIDADDGTTSFPVRELSTLQAVRHVLLTNAAGAPGGPDELVLEMRGESLRLTAGGSLAGATGRLRQALLELRDVPAVLTFQNQTPPSIGNDHVVAVNLTRPVLPPPQGGGASRQESVLEEARMAAAEKCGNAARGVEVTHFLGGPCDPDEIVCCLVAGGAGKGWTVINEKKYPGCGDGAALLAKAISIAHTRVSRGSLGNPRAAAGAGAAGAAAEGEPPSSPAGFGGSQLYGGCAGRLRGLVARADLNGQVGVLLKFNAPQGRWMLRLPDGSGKQVRPENIEAVGPRGQGLPAGQPAGTNPDLGRVAGRVAAFWGDARWSRAQLLGEIARGHWGLCKASVCDVVTSCPEERYPGLNGRLAFAPVTEMTEDFMRNGHRAMDAYRQEAPGMGQGSDHASDEEGDEDNP